MITVKTLDEWCKLCPYGKWTCADGREVLFNRAYWPILERSGSGQPVRPAHPGEWIGFTEQERFFNDYDSPWSSRPERAATVERINGVLRDWGVPILCKPPKLREWRASRRGRPVLKLLDISRPVPPRKNLWEGLIR